MSSPRREDLFASSWHGRKEEKMGQISLFFGILVYMYTEPGSPHKLPHISL